MPWLGKGVVLFALALLLSGCVNKQALSPGEKVMVGKYDPVTHTLPPSAPVREIEPERQQEGHTCGLHALESVYKSYGLDPEQYRLRFRLGTDKNTLPFVGDTRGTIQPDMLRVLNQDGFVTSPVSPEETNQIRTHLETGYYAVAVVDRGVFHWVVLGELVGNNLVIVDSLSPTPFLQPFDDFLAEGAFNIILIKPAPDGHRPSGKTRQHLMGIREMLRTWRESK